MTTERNKTPETQNGSLRLRICWVLGALWLAAFPGSLMLAGSSFGAVLGAVQQSALILILLLHCSLLYGWAGAGAYVVIGVVVGFLFEASSIATGFPFGSYVHNVPGPRLLGVTVPGILIYVVVGWYAWAVTRAICLDRPDRNRGFGRYTTPLIAAFVLAGFDYPFDPIGATVQGMWTFTYPSGQFGVPLTNNLGWIFTGWVLFQTLALIEHRFRAEAASASRSYWLLPCLMWIATALQYPIFWAMSPDGVIRQGGRTFVIADIYEAAFAGSLFTLVLTGMIGVVRLLRPGFSGSSETRS